MPYRLGSFRSPRQDLLPSASSTCSRALYSPGVAREVMGSLPATRAGSGCGGRRVCCRPICLRSRCRCRGSRPRLGDFTRSRRRAAHRRWARGMRFAGAGVLAAGSGGFEYARLVGLLRGVLLRTLAGHRRKAAHRTIRFSLAADACLLGRRTCSARRRPCVATLRTATRRSDAFQSLYGGSYPASRRVCTAKNARSSASAASERAGSSSNRFRVSRGSEAKS